MRESEKVFFEGVCKIAERLTDKGKEIFGISGFLWKNHKICLTISIIFAYII